ncbi:MAG: hypothetical protein IKX44_07530 [Prevotella sp.]|nr:hypothetical protein [Prevotella sp.]
MVRLLKKVLLLGIFTLGVNYANAQGYDQERIQLANFIERMYNNAPFDGCRIIDDYDNSYLLSVVALDKSKYKTAQIMNRVADVKSQRNAGEFFNGSHSYTSMTIKTPKGEEHESDMTEVYELIRVNSIGYVKQMQLLTSFEDANKMQVFVYYKRVEKNTIKQ